MSQPETLGKHVGRFLEIRCTACKHTSYWPKKMAVAVFGERATVYMVTSRLRCSVCRKKQAVVGRA